MRSLSPVRPLRFHVKKQGDKFMDRVKPNWQNKYRKAQHTKGLVRYELQVNVESKARFEELVEAASEEYAQPFDKRQRMAKARASLFDEVTRNVLHEFFELKDKIKRLRDEIKALSPTFFKTDEFDNVPLPESISALPDSPEKLKNLLARLYRESQRDKNSAMESKRKADQYLSLYETMSDYNDVLKKSLQENEIEVSD